MLFAPRNCPHCGIKWTDRAHSGICDLCGYDLAERKQTASPHGPSRRQIETQRAATIPRVVTGPRPRVAVAPVSKVRDDPERGAYRPLLPGILVRDPDDLLSAVDPTLLTGLANRMNRILGRMGEGQIQGRLPAKRVPKVLEVLQAIYLAVPGSRAELLVVSEPEDLPVRVTVVPAGPEVANLPGRPVSTTIGRQSAGRLRAILRLILILGAMAYFFLMKYLEHR